MSDPDLRTVCERFTAERIGPYLTLTAGDEGLALELYAWNASISAAMFEVLHHVEITLRNSVNEQLVADGVRNRRTENWFDGGVWFDPRQNETIEYARESIRSRGREPTVGRVVSELPMGFWKQLLTRKYHERLWIPSLRLAFPHYRGPRDQVYTEVDRACDLRNRIAHHEPIHDRSHEEERQCLLKIIAWICPVTCEWVDEHTRLDGVLARRPASPRAARPQ